MYKEKVEHILQYAGELVVEMRRQGLKTELKEDGTPVTNADKAASDFLTAALLAAFPGTAVVSEEHADTSGVGATHTWVIDPIDGTKHFAKGGDMFSVMVSLFDTKPIFSMIYYPVIRRWFWAERGKGAFMKDRGQVKQLRIQRPEDPPRIIFSPDCEFPIGVEGSRGTMKHFSKIVQGKLDCYVKGCVGYWDLVPPMLLVTEAGGVVVDFAGKPIELTNEHAMQQDVVAGHPAVVQDVLKQIKEHQNI
jgi:fructose-1,6-bisphosphatase/inositol monophosphatase family enzyme